jgi:CheY-like chemotaxis protein
MSLRAGGQVKAVRILIVDDNEINLRLAAEVLQDVGYVVDTAVDAESALETISVTPPDLILMDIGLPGMDGLTLTKLLKSQPVTEKIVVVALTAFAMKGDAEKAFEAGCDGYITKPFDTRQLPIQVSETLKKARNSAKKGDRTIE